MIASAERIAPDCSATAWVYAAWVADMESQGIDGQALIDEARALMAEYESAN